MVLGWRGSGGVIDTSQNVGASSPMSDMIVVQILMSPAIPVAGQTVTFHATVKNQGNAATPAGVKNGLVFYVDGTPVTWAAYFTSSLAPGASVILTANGGPSGSSTWTAPPCTHPAPTLINHQNLFPD